jgi:hypothetical protein
MKKFFLVLLILLAGISGLSAAPLHPGGGNDTPLHETAFTQAVDLICLWSDQYRQGLLTQDEFRTLATGRIALAVRDYLAISHLKAGAESMRSLAEKTRKNVDRFFIYRERELGIQSQ